MFGENLKTLRKAKGLSQEELAIRLHVVRQTVSKWEKGLSVPDADLLIRIAEDFEVPVSSLLGANSDLEITENPQEVSVLAEHLSRINEQLAIRNNRARKIWKIVGIVLLSFTIFYLLFTLWGLTLFSRMKTEVTEGERVVLHGEADDDELQPRANPIS